MQDRDAVVLKVLDRKTAGIVAGAVTVIGRNGDAGGVAHHVIDRVETEIVHRLACYHRDRLWGFARCQHHARSSRNAAGGVGARTFSDGAQLVGADLGGAQFQAAARRRQCLEHVAIGTFDGGIATATQQGFESGRLVVGAVQAGSRQPLKVGGLKNNRYPGLLCKTVQGTAQRAGWNVIGLYRCRLRLGDGAAQHASRRSDNQVNGQGQRGAGPRAKTPARVGGSQHGKRSPLGFYVSTLTAGSKKAEGMRIIIF